MQSKNIHDNPGPVSLLFFFLDYINPLQMVRSEGRGGGCPRFLSINKVHLILYIFIYFFLKIHQHKPIGPSPPFVWILHFWFDPSICVCLFTLKNEATYVPGMLTVTKRSLIFFLLNVTKMITFTAWLENIYKY